MIKEYELTLLVTGNLNDKDALAIFETAQKTLEQNDAKVLNFDDWGRRKLAYKVKGSDFGYYRFVRVEIEGNEAAKIVDLLRLNPNFLRVMIIDAGDIPEKKIVEAPAEAKPAEKAPQVEAKAEEKKEEPKEEKKTKTKAEKPAKAETKAEVKAEAEKPKPLKSAPKAKTEEKLAEKAKEKLKINEEEEEKRRMAELEKKLGEILKE